MVKTIKFLAEVVLLLLGIVWLVPLLWMAATSFRAESDNVATSILPHHWTLATFAAGWNAAPFPSYFFNTILIAGGIVALQLVTSLLAAYAFARMRFAGRNFLFYLYLVQMMVPASALVIPNYLSMKELGLLDTRIAIMLPYTFFGR